MKINDIGAFVRELARHDGTLKWDGYSPHQIPRAAVLLCPYPTRNLAELQVAVRVLERVVDAALGDLPERLDERPYLVGLRVRDGEDRVRVPVERVDDLHFALGVGPLPPDEVPDGVRLGLGAEGLRVDRRPLGQRRHGATANSGR